MYPLLAVFLMTGFYPLLRAFWQNRTTTIRHAIIWAVLAWMGWLAMVIFASLGAAHDPDLLRYVALALTGCVGVAVMGARRPIVGPWNFVVLGLLAVLLLPALEKMVLGNPSWGWLRTAFVAMTVGILVLNYLPTRLGWAAFLLALACGSEFYFFSIGEPAVTKYRWPGLFAMGLVPWIALFSVSRGPTNGSTFDRTWRDFRDRYGVVWSQRVREQFNLAAKNANWPVQLKWTGLTITDSSSSQVNHELAQMTQTLQALVKRFDL